VPISHFSILTWHQGFFVETFGIHNCARRHINTDDVEWDTAPVMFCGRLEWFGNNLCLSVSFVLISNQIQFIRQ
jgi:hypothetical protein